MDYFKASKRSKKLLFSFNIYIPKYMNVSFQSCKAGKFKFLGNIAQVKYYWSTLIYCVKFVENVCCHQVESHMKSERGKYFKLCSTGTTRRVWIKVLNPVWRTRQRVKNCVIVGRKLALPNRFFLPLQLMSSSLIIYTTQKSGIMIFNVNHWQI